MASVQDLIAERNRRSGVTVQDLQAEAARRRQAAAPVQQAGTVVADPGTGAPIGALPPRADTAPAPAPAAPGMLEQGGRGLRLGAQAVGRGVADVAGAPVDIASLLTNLVLSGANTAGADLPLADNPVGGSEWLSDVAGDVARAAAGPGAIVPPEDMSPGERLMNEIVRFGSAGAVGSGGVKALGDAAPRALSAPFAAQGSDARVLVGDTLAGAGSGAGIGAFNELLPEQTQEALGPLGEFFAGILGGFGGAGAARVGETAVRAPGSLLRRSGTVPEDVIPRDPETMQPVKTKDADRAAVLFQGGTTDPAGAAKRIEDYLASVQPGEPVPSTALVADDPGLLSLERRARTDPAAAPKFIAADRAVADYNSEQLAAMRPEGADPAAPRAVAQRDIADQTAAARGAVQQAETDLAGQDSALTEFATMLRLLSKDQASTALDNVLVDQAFLPRRAEKNALYDAAAADPNAVVGTEQARAAAEGALAASDAVNPALRDPKARGIAEAFTVPRETAAAPTGQTLPETPQDAQNPRVVRQLSQVMADRQRLSQIEQESRAAGDFGRADTAKGIRKGVNEDVRAAAESGVPGTEKLAQADSYYRTEFAPYFRNGNVSPKFFGQIDKDGSRAATPPEQTAEKFLRAGSSGRAAAEDVASILRIAPDPAEGMAAATDYVLADAAGKVIGADGKISETALARFITQREGMFGQLPEVRQRFDALLKDVRDGTAKRNTLASALEQARVGAKLTERQINEGALKLIADSEPRKAVAAVFAGKDTPAAMREAVERFKADPAAAQGWKAAVTDYLVDQVTTASKAAVSDANDTVSLAKIRNVFSRNEAALAEVYSPAEMQALQQIKKRLEVMSNRGAQASTGSATGENLGGLRGVITALAGPLGTITAVTRGALMGGSVERRTKIVAEQFPDADAAARRIIERAQFDPKLAAHLLRMPTQEVQVYDWSRKLNEILNLGRAGAGDGED